MISTIPNDPHREQLETNAPKVAFFLFTQTHVFVLCWLFVDPVSNSAASVLTLCWSGWSCGLGLWRWALQWEVMMCLGIYNDEVPERISSIGNVGLQNLQCPRYANYELIRTST